MAKNLVKRLLEGVAVLTAAISLATCEPIIINFPPTAILSAYQKQGSEENNPAIVIDLDGRDFNGKNDIIEYNVSIKDKNGTEVEKILETIPISKTILINEGTFYVSGACKDTQGATDSVGPIEVKISKTNYSPVANLSINPTSGESPLEVLINFTGTDRNGDNDIIEYKVEIDNNKDGTMDETITQTSPINITKQFETSSNISGKCTDSKGGIGTAGPVGITIDEPIVNPPVANLGLSLSSGNAPLELLVSINGTKTDNNIVKYQIGVDNNEDSVISEDEIIIDSESPISNKLITLTESTAKTFYGICIDSADLKGIDGPREVNVNNSVQPTDLTGDLTFPNAPYNIGGKFTFSAHIINNTEPLNSVKLDNSNHQSLEYKLLRRLGQGVYEKILDKNLENEVVITFNSDLEKMKNRGYLIFEQKEDDNLYLTITNARAEYEIYAVTIKDSPIHYSEAVPCYLLEKSGNHLIQTAIKYSIDSENKTLVFLSSEFQVSP